MTATTKAAKMKANAELTKAERAEAARWKVCNSCGMERRLRAVDDGTMVWVNHNRYVPVERAPGQLPGEMQPCPGSGQQPAPQDAPPPTVFTDEAYAPSGRLPVAR